MEAPGAGGGGGMGLEAIFLHDCHQGPEADGQAANDAEAAGGGDGLHATIRLFTAERQSEYDLGDDCASGKSAAVHPSGRAEDTGDALSITQQPSSIPERGDGSRIWRRFRVKPGMTRRRRE